MTSTNDGMGKTVAERYVARFGEALPHGMSWCGSAADLLRLMERAIEEGRALTATDLDAAQSLQPPAER